MSFAFGNEGRGGAGPVWSGLDFGRAGVNLLNIVPFSIPFRSSLDLCRFVYSPFICCLLRVAFAFQAQTAQLQIERELARMEAIEAGKVCMAVLVAAKAKPVGATKLSLSLSLFLVLVVSSPFAAAQL